MNESPPEQEPILSLRASRVASARKRGLGSAVFASARPVEVKIFGDDLDVLTQSAARVQAVLQNVRGAADVKTEQVSGLPVLTVKLNRWLVGS